MDSSGHRRPERSYVCRVVTFVGVLDRGHVRPCWVFSLHGLQWWWGGVLSGVSFLPSWPPVYRVGGVRDGRTRKSPRRLSRTLTRDNVSLRVSNCVRHPSRGKGQSRRDEGVITEDYNWGFIWLDVSLRTESHPKTFLGLILSNIKVDMLVIPFRPSSSRNEFHLNKRNLKGVSGPLMDSCGDHIESRGLLWWFVLIGVLSQLGLRPRLSGHHGLSEVSPVRSLWVPQT